MLAWTLFEDAAAEADAQADVIERHRKIVRIEGSA
jgi:hypothetical protein